MQVKTEFFSDEGSSLKNSDFSQSQTAKEFVMYHQGFVCNKWKERHDTYKIKKGN